MGPAGLRVGAVWAVGAGLGVRRNREAAASVRSGRRAASGEWLLSMSGGAGG
ncbi:hypothetical protein Apa02nite_040470 [Actinoplanes palleronii]|uniref:Uncharacterized protein n=1 Tax=Actinoplanes palleronii TaxID=113570 RepID=A0ABQ4BB61_9ACTN|nr:hypothetical protein Apa02nite_040470 [Actinoplanes palleronii]